MRDVAEENRQKLVQGVAAGAIATILMTALLLAGPALLGVRVPRAAEHAVAALAARPRVGLVAIGVHFGYGALAGALFSVGARRVNLVSGLFFGLVLWGVAALVYAPLVGLGFVVAHDPALAGLTLPAHLLYGGTLGALGPTRARRGGPLDQGLPLTLADE